MASKRKQVCVIVAGMHRSGTSALTRVLNLIGCSLPTTLLAANPTNEAGHWEPQRIQEFNDRLLASAGCGWDDWTPVPQDWFDSLAAAAFKDEAAELFKAEYEGAPLTVFKDPRVCRLLPFWLSVLDGLGVKAVTVIPVRHPLEVAKSLAVRDLSDPQHNRLLWLRHILDTERYTRGLPRYFCSYDDLLESWSAVVGQIGDALDIKWPRMSPQSVEEVEAFLKPQLRHHRLSPRLFDNDRSEPEWLRTAYTVVARWASNGEDADGVTQLDRISSAMNEAGEAFGLLALRGRVAMAKLRSMEAELTLVQQGRSEALDEKEQEIAALRAQLAAAETRADEASSQLGQANTGRDAARAEVASLSAALSEAARHANEELDIARSRSGDLQAQVAALQADRDRNGQLVETLKANIDVLLEDHKEQDATRSQLVAAENELAVLVERLTHMEGELVQSNSALRQRSAEAEDAYLELQRIRDVLHAETADKARVERAVDGLKANVSLLLSDIEERDAEISRIKIEAQTFTTKIQAGQQKLNEILVDSQITMEKLVRGVALQPVPLVQGRQTAMRNKIQLIREAGVVDPDWYRAAYPDVVTAGVDPIEHFITKGYLEGRRPRR